jgi:hypothetical protein
MNDIENKVETSKRAEKADRGKKADREYVMEFADANTRIAVRVQQTKAFRPYYSIVFGRYVQHENGESFVPYIPVRSEVEFAQVKSVQDHAKLIASLITDATVWIREQLQKREDEIIELQQQRESRNDPRPQNRPGLKQLSKIDRVTKAYT